VSSNKIAVNAPNTEHKRLENKAKILAKEPEIETLMSYIKSIYTI
jgi:hypothetical protein